MRSFQSNVCGVYQVPVLHWREFRRACTVCGIAKKMPGDVWSMGCVMFEMFTNRLPFEVRVNACFLDEKKLQLAGVSRIRV